MTVAKPPFDFRQRAAQDGARIARWGLGRNRAVIRENRMKKVTLPCVAMILLGCTFLSPATLRAQDYPLAPGTTWTYHLHKDIGPLAHFGGEDARMAKNGVVETTLIAHVVGTEDVSGKPYVRVEAMGEGKLVNIDWYALTPGGLLHARAVDYGAESQSDFDPPEVLLSHTLATGESWTWQDRNGVVSSKKTAFAPEQITVPAGSYRAISVRTDMVIPTQISETQVVPMNIIMTQWFAPGVGFIKQDVRFEINGHMLSHNLMTLEKFERAAPK
jgi:hypothetical protein